MAMVFIDDNLIFQFDLLSSLLSYIILFHAFQIRINILVLHAGVIFR